MKILTNTLVFSLLTTCTLTSILYPSQVSSSSTLESSNSTASTSSTTTIHQETAESQFARGMYLLSGIGTHKNLAKAFIELQQAADNGHHAALATLWHLFRKGIFIEKDEKIADAYFKQLCITLNNQDVRDFSECCLEYKKFIQPNTPIDCGGKHCAQCAGSNEVESLFERGDVVAQLPCKHSICHTCLEQLFEDRSEGQLPKCPECHHEFKTDHIVYGIAV